MAVPLRPTSYAGGLTLVPAPNRPRTMTLWTLGEWRCEREGLTVQLYRKDFLTSAVTVPDDEHVRECATQWLAGVPSGRRRAPGSRHSAKKH